MSNKPIFVFGSNEAGRHGAGAAYTALKQHGAVYGMSYGHYGDSFAIPTKDRAVKNPLPMSQIKGYVEGFVAYARSHPEWTFQVTRIGCGLAGWTDEYIAPLFMFAPDNCLFDEKWRPWIQAYHKTWGTF
jgi:hypothetical protein